MSVRRDFAVPLWALTSTGMSADAALVHAEVFVGAQVLLRLLIEHGDEQTAIRKIQLVLCLVVIALERQFGEIQTVADVDHACVVQPLNAAAVIAETRTGRDLRNLEFLVVLGKLDNGSGPAAVPCRLEYLLQGVQPSDRRRLCVRPGRSVSAFLLRHHAQDQ